MFSVTANMSHLMSPFAWSITGTTWPECIFPPSSHLTSFFNWLHSPNRVMNYLLPKSIRGHNEQWTVLSVCLFPVNTNFWFWEGIFLWWYRKVGSLCQIIWAVSSVKAHSLQVVTILKWSMKDCWDYLCPVQIDLLIDSELTAVLNYKLFHLSLKGQ